MEKRIQVDVIGFPTPFSNEQLSDIRTKLENQLSELCLSDAEEKVYFTLSRKKENNEFLTDEELEVLKKLEQRKRDSKLLIDNAHILQNQMLLWGGYSAGICYMKDSWEDLFNENPLNTLKRIRQTLNSGHHSVYDHQQINLLLTGIPKIMAMFLNNEGQYTTSEKSARYTKMNDISDKEKELYYKWLEIIKSRVLEEYGYLGKYNPKFTPTGAEKIGQENARYMTSVGTPTTMEYSTSYRQLNYLYSWLEDFGRQGDSNFVQFILPFFEDFKTALEIKNEFLSYESDGKKVLLEPGLHKNEKNRGYSLLVDLERHNATKEVFDYVYTLKYKVSFASLAQFHRYRPARCTMAILDEPEYFVPPIVKGTHSLKSLESEWLADISKVADLYPQGMKVSVCETGTLDQFIEKGKERACINAQQETREMYLYLVRYLYNNLLVSNPYWAKYLKPYLGMRCTYPDYRCPASCKLPHDVKEKIKI